MIFSLEEANRTMWNFLEALMVVSVVIVGIGTAALFIQWHERRFEIAYIKRLYRKE
ncbi:MAG: hypothetical protein QG626_650 [Patescibacteria group bacterium]|jgi:hypothetical protein|nr:hypothetical protein [Patescibacteria group bacterium]